MNEVRMHLYMVAASSSRGDVRNVQRYTRTFVLGGQNDLFQIQINVMHFMVMGLIGSDSVKVGVPLQY